MLLLAVATPSLGGRVAGAQADPLGTVAATPETAADGDAEAASDRPWLNVRDQELLDLDGRGGADALRVEGYWNAGRRPDTVTVYATEGDLPPVADYALLLDFDRTLWVFDPQSEGRATLIVRFVREGDRSVAYLWGDQNGDRRVAYEVEGRDVEITESPHWSMKVWTTGTWLRPDGRPTMDLHAVMDGCGDCGSVGAVFPAAVARRMVVDGQPDLAFDMVDADDDGAPEWRTRRILTPLSDSAFALPFFFLNGNEGGVVPAPIGEYIFWPLLAPNDAPVEPSNYFDTAPFIPVDWRRGRIGLPALVGYPIEHGYHVNSRAAVHPEDDPAHVNFENPMAYFDLAEDHDGFPELHVRFEYYGAHDSLLLRGQADRPQIDVRYSWNQTNGDGLFWDYKMNVHGLHAIEDRLAIGDLDLAIVPHAEVPGWVRAREWDVATFVAVEREEGYGGSEGIYEWGVTSPATRPYFAGFSPAGPHFDEIPIGLRGEHTARPGPAELYLDPIDGRLHLVRTEGGFWNLGQGREMRYLNLDSGDTIDGWQLWDNGELVSQLQRVPGGLLYADAAGTFFREVTVPEEVLRTAPPADHAEWVALGEHLAANRVEVAGDDLRRLFDRFPGPTVPLSTGAASDVRPLADGFRAVVPADDSAARDALAALTGQPPTDGPQLVTRSGGGWRLAPAEASTLGWGGGGRSQALVGLGFAGLAGVAASLVLRAGRGRA